MPLRAGSGGGGAEVVEVEVLRLDSDEEDEPGESTNIPEDAVPRIRGGGRGGGRGNLTVSS